MAKYVAWDYEIPGFYHIFDLDKEPKIFNEAFYIYAPETAAMDAKIAAIALALDEAIAEAVSLEPDRQK